MKNKTNIEKLILEFAKIGEEYRNTDDQQIKDHYDNYARIIIENEVGKEYQDNLYKYWEKLKNDKQEK